MNSVHSTFPYELRIGVTGHLSASGAVVEEAVRKLFDQIFETLCEPVTPLSFVVISPLAMGADRTVARVGLERNARLEVIAPLPIAEYRKDFIETAALVEFDELWNNAAIRTTPSRGNETSTADPKQQRELNYLHAGQQVVDASEIVIAIWDGQPESGTGGTAQIIRYAIETGRVVLWIHSAMPQMTPRWIRSVQPTLKTSRFPRRDQLSQGYWQQAEYCVNAEVDAGLLEESCEEIRKNLSRDEFGEPSPFDTWQFALSPLVREHARADMLAVSYGAWHALAVKLIYGLAAAGVGVGVAQILFLQEHAWIAIFEVAAMLAVLWAWWRSRTRAWHDRWLCNRYLAERLRSAIFIALANPKRDAEERDSVDVLPFYEGPQQWLARVTSHMRRVAAERIGETPLESLKNFVASAWIDAQYRFHSQNADRKHGVARFGHRLGTIFFAATLILASLHVLAVGHETGIGLPRILRIDIWITFLAIIFPVCGGAIHAITVQLEFERVAERSKRMAHSLQQLRQRILRARELLELQEVVKEAAALIRSETHEWWVLLNFQETRLHA